MGVRLWAAIATVFRSSSPKLPFRDEVDFEIGATLGEDDSTLLIGGGGESEILGVARGTFVEEQVGHLREDRSGGGTLTSVDLIVFFWDDETEDGVEAFEYE